MPNRMFSNSRQMLCFSLSCGLAIGVSACAGRGLPDDPLRADGPPAAQGEATANGGGNATNTGAQAGEAQAGDADFDDLPPSDNPDVDAGFGSGGASGGSSSTGASGFMIPDLSGIFPGNRDAAVPALSDAAPTTAGELVISELMANPVGSTSHEWLELYNPSAKTFDLIGCTLSSDSAEHVIGQTLLIAPKAYVVLGRDSAASDGIAVLYTYTSVSFSSSRDDVALHCGTPLIDSFHYETEVSDRAQSTQLSVSLLDAAANDAASAWCLGTAPIGVSENRGTPGTANRSCP